MYCLHNHTITVLKYREGKCRHSQNDCKWEGKKRLFGRRQGLNSSQEDIT